MPAFWTVPRSRQSFSQMNHSDEQSKGFCCSKGTKEVGENQSEVLNQNTTGRKSLPQTMSVPLVRDVLRAACFLWQLHLGGLWRGWSAGPRCQVVSVSIPTPSLFQKELVWSTENKEIPTDTCLVLFSAGMSVTMVQRIIVEMKDPYCLLTT